MIIDVKIIEGYSTVTIQFIPLSKETTVIRFFIKEMTVDRTYNSRYNRLYKLITTILLF